MLGVWTEYFLEGTKFWPGALSTLDFGILTSLRAPIKNFLLGSMGNGHFGPIPGQEPFWSSILALWQPSGPPLKFPFGINGKRPFWAKSWPGTLLELDVAILTAIHITI